MTSKKIPEPRDGEPIKLVWTALDADGQRTPESKPRYRVVLDAGTPGGKRRQVRTTHDSLTEARAHVKAVQVDRKRGQYVAPDRQTVNDALDDWLAGARHLKPSTKHGYEVHLRPVRERIGSIALQALTKRHVDDLVTYLSTTGGLKGAGRSASTVRQALVVLNEAVQDAVRADKLTRNVVALVRKPQVVSAEPATWSAEQLGAFLDAAEVDRYSALWNVAAHGLRRGEVVGLRWSDVDLDAAEARVRQNRVAVDGTLDGVAVGEPKTAAGRRTVPLDARAVRALRALRALQASERLAAGECYEATDLIAVDELGRPISPDAFSDRFAKIAKAAGLPVIRLHDTRHTRASLLVEAGVDIRTVADLLGHADAAFALKRYVHSSDDRRRAATAAVATLLETRSAV